MQRTLDDISKQLIRCAALMSDAQLLHTQPDFVADQFSAAMVRIEGLRLFLARPASLVDPCQQKRWMDTSVLDVGVKPMVSIILQRHMQPLRMKPGDFPEVFEKEMRNRDGDEEYENFVIREIKENNCVGAIVLLYFYLFWHILLILLNERHFPCVSHCNASSPKSDVNWASFFEDVKKFNILPSGSDLLELRDWHKFAASIQQMGQNIEVDDLLLDFPMWNTCKKGTPRQSNLIFVYRSCLDLILKTTHLKETGGYKGIDAMRGKIIHSKMLLFNQTLSTFDIDDSINKWHDMHKYFEIKTSNGVTDTKIFKVKLIDIIQCEAFSLQTQDQIVQNLKCNAIFDYGSASIMMDILSGLFDLKRLIDVFVSKSEFSEKQLNHELYRMLICPFYKIHEVFNEINRRDLNVLDDETPKRFQDMFLFEAANGNHEVTDIDYNIHHVMKNSIKIDNLMGYYYGSRPSNLSMNSNSAYFMIPIFQLKNGNDRDFIVTLTNLMNGSKTFRAILIPALRNSLFTFYMIETLELFWKKLECNVLKIAKVDMSVKFANEDSSQFSNHQSFHDNSIYNGIDIDPLTDEEFFPNVDGEDWSYQQVQELLKQEKDELNKYRDLIKRHQFTKYPNISWPIQWTDDKNTKKSNVSIFKYVRNIAYPIKSISESVHDIANLARFCNNPLKAIMLKIQQDQPDILQNIKLVNSDILFPFQNTDSSFNQEILSRDLQNMFRAIHRDQQQSTLRKGDTYVNNPPTPITRTQA